MTYSHEISLKGKLDVDEVRDIWPLLDIQDRVEALRLLPRDDAEDLFFALSPIEQYDIVASLPTAERRSWVRLLAPDDTADLIQAAPPEQRQALLALLDPPTRVEVTALLAYAEDAAGGLMSPRFARVRPEMTVDEAITYLRKQAREQLETIYYAYVLDEHQRLLGVVSFRDLFRAGPSKLIRDIMQTDLVTVLEDTDQEEVSRLFTQYELAAIPVIDATGRIKGIVTIDDIVDVVEEEATEDIHKIGGTEALDAPYLSISFWRMIKKRAGWLSVLFVGEPLTATAMGHFEEKIAKAVILAMFVPLIISSGGNSGSQASTLVIRAMALGEVRLREWWRVSRRELGAGLVLGSLLGTFGFMRVVLWEFIGGGYGTHSTRIGLTVGVSLLGVVMFGTLSGAMLPFLLRSVGFDPASASAPFVATLVDVTGVVIYFSVAAMLLTGTLL